VAAINVKTQNIYGPATCKNAFLRESGHCIALVTNETKHNMQ